MKIHARASSLPSEKSSMATDVYPLVVLLLDGAQPEDEGHANKVYSVLRCSYLVPPRSWEGHRSHLLSTRVPPRSSMPLLRLMSPVV